MSLAKRTWRGGTSWRRAAIVDGFHQEVSNSRLGYSSIRGQSASNAPAPQWARMIRACGCSVLRWCAWSAISGTPWPAWTMIGIREREHVVEPHVDQIEALAARMELQPDGAVVQAALGLAERVVGRIEAREGPDSPVRPPAKLPRAPVGLGVAARLLQREHDAVRARELQRPDGLLLGGQQ